MNVIVGVKSQLSVAVGFTSGGKAAPHSIVASAAQVITGGIRSFTLSTREQVAVLPQPSVACHVRVIVNGQVPEPVTSLIKVTVTPLPLQASTAVGVTGAGIFAQSTVIFGVQVITGGVVSSTVITR